MLQNTGYQIQFLPPPPPFGGSDPLLSWNRGEPDGGWRVPGHPLYTQEKIHPYNFVESLAKNPDQSDLFHEFNGLPANAHCQWYRHEGNWQNRMIRGDSAQVMASLVEREGMRASVQMVYFDPPYGVSFRGNFQTATKNRDTSPNNRGIPNDLATVQAFRDSYEDGIHSYLDGIQRNCRLIWELLTESGSLFLQIGNSNMPRLSLLLDEVFGAGNRIAIIPFKKTGSSAAKLLPETCDYILWYAKSKEVVKYNNLYQQLNAKEKLDLMASYAMVELPTGEVRSLTKAERDDPTRIREGHKLFRRAPLFSMGGSSTGRNEPFVWNGKQFECPPNGSWRVSMRGLDRLAEKGRLVVASDESSLLHWKWYAKEIPGRKISNLWDRVMSPTELHFVVETAESVVERCLLMSTEPGDLVFDPTCGSGTTAYVSEKWGRRWITADTSAIAISLARQRIATATFDYHLLQDSEEGSAKEREVGGAHHQALEPPWGDDVSKGFVYARTPTVSAAILAYDRDVPPTLLVNQPYVRPRTIRVSSPFTVESASPQRYLPASDRFDDAEVAIGEDRERQRMQTERILEALSKGNILIQTDDGAVAGFEIRHILARSLAKSAKRRLVSHVARCNPVASGKIGSGKDRKFQKGVKRNAAIAIAPDDVTVPQEYVNEAFKEAKKLKGVDHLIVIGFAFEPSIEQSSGRKETSWTIIRAQANRDLMIEELAPEKGHAAFVMIGEPEIEIREQSEAGGDVVVEVTGFQTFNPVTGNINSGGKNDIHCWMMDTNYDGKSFKCRDLHFLHEADSQLQRLKRSLRTEIDAKAWKAMTSRKSNPFPRPATGLIAVRIITSTGTEMTAVVDVNRCLPT